MSPELLVAVAAVISSVGQILDSRFGSGKALRTLMRRVVRIEDYLRLPPLEEHNDAETRH